MHLQNQKPGLSSWQKWALMTVIVGGLSGIVTYFNYRGFGTWDGLPYSAVVAFLTLLSFIVTLHIRRGTATTNFLRAAFVFEVLLCVALGLNAAYSLSVMRDDFITALGQVLHGLAMSPRLPSALPAGCRRPDRARAASARCRASGRT